MFSFKEYYKQFLTEMPELRNWTQKHVKHDTGFRSDESLNRLFMKLHEDFELPNGETIYFYLNKKKFNAIGIVRKFNEIENKESNYEICKIDFYHPDPISKLPDDIENPLQVSQVFTNESYEGEGIATLLYILLIQLNYTIVSDRIQYLGGQALWKKLSRRSKINDIVINVLTDKKYKVDSKNNIENYNGSNINDSDIWKTHNEGQKTILISRLRKEEMSKIKE